MDLETQYKLRKCIAEDFDNMKGLIDTIQRNIEHYPVEIQLGFIAPIKNILVEATRDTLNPDDSYLNQMRPALGIEPEIRQGTQPIGGQSPTL